MQNKLYNDTQVLTQHEAAQLVSFIANTVAQLVTCNNDCLLDDDDGDFVRLQDVTEVIDTLASLHSKANYADDDKQASYNITAADAREALYGYDTEYREQIMEEFEEACAELASKLWRNVDSGMLLNKIVTFK